MGQITKSIPGVYSFVCLRLHKTKKRTIMAARRTTRRRRASKRRASRKTRRTTRRRRRVSRRRVTRRTVKRRRKRTPVRGSRRQVWNGTRSKTNGALLKGDLMKNKRGLIVSKKARKHGLKQYTKNLKPWTQAFVKARKNLNVKGFVACKKGSKLYKETMRLYKA